MDVNKNLTIRFSDLNYYGTDGLLKNKQKQILKNINGRFQGGELTAIVGPSGSGKTSLLNAIARYRRKGISGNIKVNGDDIKLYKNQIAYVMQESHMYGLLTVLESMKYAVKLKIGIPLSPAIISKISKILKMFSLEGHEKTFVKHLSGGQCKRLSIALEIINDPKIIFLDECTSGLDSASSYQCIKLLRQLVYKGHTIICTIHQPSTLMLEMFDHIYAVANGQCIYQGSLKNLLKFLKEIDFQCPQTYNPIDYLMEIANDIYGERNCDLINQIENGRNENFCQSLKYEERYETDEFEAYPIPTFNSQLLYLMQRNVSIILRDFTYTYFRLFAHLFLGVLVGFTFWQIGNDASSVFKDFRLLIGVMILLVYTSLYSQITLFPTHNKVIKRECFNNWYSPRIFNIALFITDCPITIVCVLLFLIPMYIMTNQPPELFRFGSCFLILLLLSYNSQNIGLLAGSVKSVLLALIIAPFLMIHQIALSGTFILQKDAHPLIGSLFKTTFLNYATEGMKITIFGFNRTQLDCDDIYCHYAKPEKLLQFLQLNSTYEEVIIVMTLYMIILRIIIMTIVNFQLKAK
ncbi:hypothetical protein ACKWTF_006170 [Chironomus riparius]